MRFRWFAVATVLLVLLAGCSGDGDGDGDGDEPDPSSGPTTSQAPEPPKPGRRPQVGDCHRLTYAEALAPVAATKRVRCGRRPTALTFHVGRIERNARGKPRAVDSARVQRQVSTTCPEQLIAYLGGSADQVHRSLLTTVWFTPTLEQAQAGAAWFRCDVVAPSAGRSLMVLPADLRGAMADDAVRERFAMCATGEPGEKSFTRIPCTAPHSWRAVSTVELSGDAYPGADAIAATMDGACTDAATEAASNPLDVRWSQEGPTERQWKAGQRHGLCWVPS